ncbi:uncharacterized protein LOC105779055 [Gossypium raimondii]|uniref:uncharacterized protein LOC105779055 n=1 Tax=Gossypium raimondii TaxID=29730 RepID=UPI00227D5608|nr:uncharacterized protein LOC105779055 [Gossypium raimondii]
MCMDYRDLNKARPKDNFPLLHIDILVDNTVGYSLFSFMDGFSRYNQLKMHPKDVGKTTFITLSGTFCYKVISFGLKNTRITYQRAMVTLFHDMIHKEIEVYVDDMITKSRTEEEHVQVLRKLFLRLRKFQLKLNPTKCTFGARSGKLLGFVVSGKGIEIDPDKVKVIRDLSPPRTQKEVRVYVSQKAVKGSAIADFLASSALEDYEPLNFDFPNEDLMYVATTKEDSQMDRSWKLNFDRASNTVGNEIGAVLVSPSGDHYPQLKGEWEMRDPKLISYRKLVLELIDKFDDITFCYLPRDENHMADALATLASMIKVMENDKRTLRRLAINYVLDGEILYKRGKDQVLLRCVDTMEAKKVLGEVHEGICGMHANGFIIARQIMRFRKEGKRFTCVSALLESSFTSSKSGWKGGFWVSKR